MSSEHLLIAFLAMIAASLVIGWSAYQIGRLHGYYRGLQKGEQATSRVHHLKGMTDGYVMAIQHTPEQRNEYMNNVLLRTGAITPGDIEADRRRRLRR